jgi:hypothetical protein
MLTKRIFALILVLTLVTMACGINLNLPLRDVKTGPTQTDEINVPNLSTPGAVANVSLGFAAGKLSLTPGAEGSLVSGTAKYNVEDLKPIVQVNGDQVRIDTGDLNLEGIPDFGNELVNEWDLKLGSAPMRLTINSGAYEGSMDLGGLALQSLEVSDGAAQVNLQFSRPNTVEMDTFQYKTGASSVELRGLANANFSSMEFKSGAGSYTLDFSGELKRDASVNIDAGLSSFKLIVPEGVNAQLFYDGGLTNVDVSGAWEKSGNEYTQAGSGPSLTINVTMGAGDLNLSNQ